VSATATAHFSSIRIFRLRCNQRLEGADASGSGAGRVAEAAVDPRVHRPEESGLHPELYEKSLSLRLDVVKMTTCLFTVGIPRLNKKRTPPPDETFEKKLLI